MPANAIVGVSGLELALDSSLRGTPGGELLADDGTVRRDERERAVLATATPKAASAVRTTVSPSVQQRRRDRARGTARRDRRDGPRHGTDPGRRRDRPRRPAAAGLDVQDDHRSPACSKAGLANPHTVFPYATYATLDGVKLNNANGEECGGTLALAFAVSCNSVFAPLGAKLGAARLVATAERYGFNHSPGVPGAVESTLPRRIPDPGPARRRLDRDRPGRGAGERAGDGDGRRHDRRRRPATAADLQPGRPHPRSRRRCAREQRGSGAHCQETDDRRRARRHRHGRGDPRGDGRGQDRHRRTEDARAPARLRASESSSKEESGSGESSRGKLRVGRAKRATPTPGSRPSPRHSRRGSSWACCSCRTAPAERPRRPWPVRCSKRGSGRH